MRIPIDRPAWRSGVDLQHFGQIWQAKYAIGFGHFFVARFWN
jgi:hypothetical protein